MILKERFIGFYLRSCFVLLGTTACAKTITVLTSAKLLVISDPILGITNRWLIAGMALLEIFTMASIVWWKHKPWLPSLFTSCLGGEFLLYRTVFALGHYSRGCPCLGSLGEWIPLSDQAQGYLLWLIALWLCIGGGMVFQLSVPKNGDPSANEGAPVN
jgi:hypothetical protein